MRLATVGIGCLTGIAFGLVGCVDAYEPDTLNTANVVVVDGWLTDQAEPQVVTLNRSRAEPYTGRFGTLPITDATADVIIDADQVVGLRQTAPGTYQLPEGFRGEIGRRYQLRVALADGTRYVSSAETMQPVPAIGRVSQRFVPLSIPATNPVRRLPANEFFLNTDDPADQANYYRWDWTVWEKQAWCRSCYQGRYTIYDSQNKLIEDCVTDYSVRNYADYYCRTPCWEMLHSTSLNLFADTFTNGGSIQGRRVAQIPYLHYGSCLVEIRQSSLTLEAYQYFQLVENQTQNVGGIADLPPVAPIGNVRNPANEREAVVGYFAVSSVSRVRYWLNRTATNTGPALANTLFEALNARLPEEDGRVTAVCVPGLNRTPIRPEGWPD
ncbi:DUF4249 domain-containing protein [Spirosoma utsteinense]|uniref:DUF4249 domain-containing protein n=1 Tax=Spirosoma utsteinense TaxID=2585773 RepID=A0ABR6WDS8_9BACT|nr:DUF4249 domain-containing protein [Spirosoma utsteinense]MBC3788934.1 hypothetical protein [Spirosoma utsteinense]MBC3794648.1 hypothetical protein [Spirosoma utsteinense]